MADGHQQPDLRLLHSPPQQPTPCRSQNSSTACNNHSPAYNSTAYNLYNNHHIDNYHHHCRTDDYDNDYHYNTKAHNDRCTHYHYYASTHHNHYNNDAEANHHSPANDYHNYDYDNTKANNNCCTHDHHYA